MAGELPAYALCSENMGALKRWVLESHEKIVDALYSIDNLLDRLLSKFVLTNENYNEVRAENTPTKKARKLLEIVRLQFSEEQVDVFVECLVNSQVDYPRLRPLLQNRPTPGDQRYFTSAVRSFPTVEKLRRQSSELCHRLGDLTAPITVQLFAHEVFGQVEKEQVENGATPFDRSTKLIDVCLRRGESACCLFYKALRHEDPNLATDMCAYDVENVTCVSVESTGDMPPNLPVSQAPDPLQTPVTTAFPETGVHGDATWLARAKSTDEPRTLASNQDFSPATPNSRNNGFESVFSESLTIESVGGESITIPASEKDLVNEVLALLGVSDGTGERPEYDVLGFAELLGLQRERAWEALQEAGGWDARSQVAAVVATFLEVTGGDAQRLSNKLPQCDPSWFLVSRRGACLLELVSRSHEIFRSAASESRGARDALRPLATALLDCAIAAAPSGGPLPDASPPPGIERCLELVAEALPFHRKEARDLLAELERPDADTLEQAATLVAQLVRELFRAGAEEDGGGQYGLLAAPAGRSYDLALRSPWSVTGFAGLQPRVVKKLRAEGQPDEDVRASIARILTRTGCCLATESPSDGAACDDPATPTPLRIDARLAARLRWALESDGDVDAASALHRRTLADLLAYARRVERHSFAFRVERVAMLERGGPALCGVRSAGPLAQIDGSMEETLAFLTSGPAAFVASVRCESARDGEARACSEPAACRVTFPRAASFRASSSSTSSTSSSSSSLTSLARRADLARDVASGEVVAESADAVWIRPREGVELESLVAEVRAAVAASHEPGAVHLEGFCFRVEARDRETRVRLVFDGRRIRAVVST